MTGYLVDGAGRPKLQFADSAFRPFPKATRELYPILEILVTGRGHESGSDLGAIVLDPAFVTPTTSLHRTVDRPARTRLLNSCRISFDA